MDQEVEVNVGKGKPFHYQASLMLQINEVEDAVLSLGCYEPIQQKELLSGNQVEFGRKPIEEHLESVFSAGEVSGKPILRSTPFLVVSVRNVLGNLRCGAWVRGRTTGFITVNEENGLRPARPYHVLAWRANAFEMREIDVAKESLDEYAWVFSGVPVVWDDMVLERIVTEAADHSHVFELPRGNHPSATNETRARWQRLHDVFFGTLSRSRSEAFAELMHEAAGLKRESRYLHNIIGVDAYSNLQVHIGIGKLEDLGQRLSAAGARRALLVDNGGSTSVRFYPDGIDGEYATLLEAPNHRRLGTAYLIILLRSKRYETIPDI